MIFSDAEIFILLWCGCALGFILLLALFITIVQICEYYSKTPSQRATDWVNKQIERDKHHD